MKSPLPLEDVGEVAEVKDGQDAGGYLTPPLGWRRTSPLTISSSTSLLYARQKRGQPVPVGLSVGLGQSLGPPVTHQRSRRRPNSRRPVSPPRWSGHAHMMISTHEHDPSRLRSDFIAADVALPCSRQLEGATPGTPLDLH